MSNNVKRTNGVGWDLLLLLGLILLGVGWYFVGEWPAVLVYTGGVMILVAVGAKRPRRG